jgi:hypothetical protein
VLSILLTDETRRTRFRQTISLCAPIAVAILALCAYNYFRFNSPFEFGYRYQMIDGEPAANRSYGLWSFVHFPANLYFLLFKGPEGVFLPGTKVPAFPYIRPDRWGMSILFTSPILLWGLTAPKNDQMVRLCLVTVGVMLFVLLGYYGIGVRQFGYRYALDFYPFLFVLLAKSCELRFTPAMQILIAVSAALNWHLIRFV